MKESRDDVLRDARDDGIVLIDEKLYVIEPLDAMLRRTDCLIERLITQKRIEQILVMAMRAEERAFRTEEQLADANASSVSQRRENAERNDARLSAAVAAQRRTHPALSNRKLAEKLVKVHGPDTGNRRNDLNALAQRITRLAKKDPARLRSV
ncbi:MAG TPA: hypothetical protein VNJ02_11630 [Vicinamibacterales bacterium]|nr:hypothetical protein [Vicinamibacterales bacterium]